MRGVLGALRRWKGNLNKIARLNLIECGCNGGDQCHYDGNFVGWRLNDGKFTPTQVLLIAQVLVGGDKDIELRLSEI